jgi:hypothetical protein
MLESQKNLVSTRLKKLGFGHLCAVIAYSKAVGS